MRRGVAEVHQQAVAQVLGNVPLIVVDDRRTGLLIGAHHLPQVFRIELRGEGSGVYQVAKQHRELAPFSFGDSRTRHRSLWSRGLALLGSLRSGPSWLLACLRRRGQSVATLPTELSRQWILTPA